MSVDWSKYSSHVDCKERVKVWQRNPEDYGVLALVASHVRKIDFQVIEHTPSSKNQSHTDVMGDKGPRIQILYSRIYSWAIEPPATK